MQRYHLPKFRQDNSACSYAERRYLVIAKCTGTAYQILPYCKAPILRKRTGLSKLSPAGRNGGKVPSEFKSAVSERKLPRPRKLFGGLRVVASMRDAKGDGESPFWRAWDSVTKHESDGDGKDSILPKGGIAVPPLRLRLWKRFRSAILSLGEI